MCGRYASTASRSTLLETFGIADERVDPAIGEPDYNVAPTKRSPIVLSRPVRKGDDPIRRLEAFRWGLVPFWAKDPKIGSRMINARAETVAEKPSYRRAFTARRCIVPAVGFFEWFPTSEIGRAGKPLKQPFFIHRSDGELLALAGLYELWRNPDVVDDDGPDAFLRSFTIITTESTDDVGHIHDRMPMSVAPEHWDEWLDPGVRDIGYVHSLMAPPAQGSLDTYPVSTAVNNVRSNGPQLLDPLDSKDEHRP